MGINFLNLECITCNLQNWINKYNAKLSGSGNRQTAPKSMQLHRKLSGYNLVTSDVMQKGKYNYLNLVMEDCGNLVLQPSNTVKARV